MIAARVVPLFVVGVAAAIDLRTHRIPNLLTFGAAGAALAYHAWSGGFPAVGQGVLGWLVGVGLLLPIFILGGMGAGDVKLLGAVGAWLGPAGALWTGFYSIVAGGVLALIVALLHGYLATAFRNLWRLVTAWRLGGVKPLPGLTIEDARGPRLAYGAAIAAGTLAAVCLR